MNEMMKWLRDVSVCPNCGKSRLYVAVGGRRHGTGREGERTATAVYEPFDPEKHCSCSCDNPPNKRLQPPPNGDG